MQIQSKGKKSVQVHYMGSAARERLGTDFLVAQAISKETPMLS
jgi:hypothetical protein